MSEQLEAEEKARGDLVSLPQQQNGAPTGPSQPTPRTWVHDLFQVPTQTYLISRALTTDLGHTWFSLPPPLPTWRARIPPVRLM